MTQCAIEDVTTINLSLAVLVANSFKQKWKLAGYVMFDTFTSGVCLPCLHRTRCEASEHDSTSASLGAKPTNPLSPPT